MTQSDIILLALSPLILWYVYRRVRRLAGRQKSRLWRHCCVVLFLSAALLAMFVMLLAEPAAAGVALGLAALRRTGFVMSVVAGYHLVHATELLRWRLAQAAAGAEADGKP